MMDALSIAGSALAAQSVNVGVIAGNIANAATPGYQAQQAMLAPMSTGGVAVGAVVATAQSVDLTTQLVDLIMAQQAYEAAAKIAGAADRMTGTLLAAI